MRLEQEYLAHVGSNILNFSYPSFTKKQRHVHICSKREEEYSMLVISLLCKVALFLLVYIKIGQSAPIQNRSTLTKLQGLN